MHRHTHTDTHINANKQIDNKRQINRLDLDALTHTKDNKQNKDMHRVKEDLKQINKTFFYAKIFIHNWIGTV